MPEMRHQDTGSLCCYLIRTGIFERGKKITPAIKIILTTSPCRNFFIGMNRLLSHETGAGGYGTEQTALWIPPAHTLA